MLNTLRLRLKAWQPPPWLAGLIMRGARLHHDIETTKLLAYASGMSYMTLGSIVPSLAAIFAIVSAFQSIADPNAGWFVSFQSFIINNLAPESSEQTLKYLKGFLANLNVTKIGATGFAFLFVIVILLLRNIEGALNDIWQVPRTRSLLKRFLFFWSTITLGALVLSVVVAVMAKFDLASMIPFRGKIQDESSVFGAIISFVTGSSMAFAFFALLYKIGPNCEVKLRAAALGALASTLMIRLAAWVYAAHISKSAWNHNVYGALAAVPLFLLWLYIVWVVILLGALIAWRVQHGFATPREAAASGETLTIDPLILERNRQLQALVPLYCATAVSWHFREASEGGITGYELARMLDLPPAWVRDGIRVASRFGLLVVGVGADAVLAGEQTEQDMLTATLFPTQPAEKWSMARLVDTFSDDARQWLRERKTTLPLNLERIAQLALSTLEAEGGESSFAEFLERLKAAS